MENPIIIITVLAIGIAVFFAVQSLASRKRVSSEEKVMKGYFLLGLSGLMAKIAMADGRVTGDEAMLANKFFASMDLTDAERAICIGNFVTARRDGLTARDHAKRFLAYANSAAAEFLYGMLWKMSRADGRIDPSEEALLAEIAADLGLGQAICESFKKGNEPAYDKSALRNAGVPTSLVSLA